ncbi:hypothetical protein MRX96_040046 [Rhipicephalus microplus]
MMRRVGGMMEVRNVGTDTCYSSSCSSSSDSDQNGFGAPRHLRGPTRRPGFQPPELHRRRQIATLTLELAGLPPSAHRRRCLIQVENTVGIE